jgi:hypothetical protein
MMEHAGDWTSLSILLLDLWLRRSDILNHKKCSLVDVDTGEGKIENPLTTRIFSNCF